ncbi:MULTISPECIES: chaplin [Streptomycetaceae]|uniref:chaplin n=1 Tax=Streptomycetaceae TaxID=2062 RepID=UPI00021400E0|nr:MULTISPECIES: chaplin [Streptomycetaceae]MYS61921.1 DUF320 domain-containing protein [Streptomyces sp. SID5468]CCB77811.1 putative secreted protein [Streptantibioticus cattleyicolor NRRL 8057 = DSM 46488]
MRQVTRTGLITIIATSGVLAVTGGYAFADSGASGVSANSPGVLSGNTVQVPVNVPVNACGDTVDVVGALNPAFGNNCVNGGHGHGHGHGQSHSYHHGGGASARGASTGSPGVGSGNTVQAPVDVPVNACGDTVDVVGALNPAYGNGCANHGGGRHHHQPPQHGHQPPPPGQGHQPPPPEEHQPPEQGGGHQPPQGHQPPPQHVHVPPQHGGHQGHGARPPQPVHHQVTPPRPAPQESGEALAHTGTDQLGLLGLVSAGLLATGSVLYRRGRAHR